MKHNPQWLVFNVQQAIARLPSSARRKLDNLRARLADLEVLERNSHERHGALESAILKAQYRLGNLHPKDDAETIGELNEEIGQLQSDLAKLDAERSKRAASKSNLQQVLAQLDGWIGKNADSLPALRSASFVEAQPKRGESLAEAITRVRHNIMETHGDLARLKVAPLPAAEAKAKIIAQIDAAAKRGRPQVKLDGPVAEVAFADQPMFSNPGQPKMAPAGSASALACWLWRDELIKALTSGLRDVEGAVPLDERPARETELKARLLELERQEESFIEQAIAAGLEAHRRPTASPLAILGLQFATASADVPLPEAAMI